MKFRKGLLVLGALLGLGSGYSVAADTAQPKIVGGHVAAEGAYPWMAALVQRNVSSAYDGLFCGGTVIGSNWVLTAAHCIRLTGLGAGQIDVVVGRSNLTSTDGRRVHVAEVIVHPNYDEDTSRNDVALLRLETAVNVGQIDVVLPNVTRTLTDGSPLRVIGWGRLSASSSNRPEALMEADVQMVSNERCNSSGSYNGKVDDTMLCAGVPGGGVDACNGDSGGPLLAWTGGRWVVTGVTSWGYGCGEARYPGVYNRTGNFLNWINSVISERATCKATPLYRYYNAFITDTYLSTQVFDGAYGYSFGSKQGTICTTKPSFSTMQPLYEYWKPGVDHYYTQDNLADGTLGYGSKKILGYVYPNGSSTRKPLCRYYNGFNTDHFYDAPADGVCKSFTSTGYGLEGTEGFILK